MDCVFCTLIRENSARWIARRAAACAFAPLTPLAPGHTLVVPTDHYQDLFDIPRDTVAATMALAQEVAEAMRFTLKASGVNLLHASGPGSEQSVPHFHIHVVPRWPDDGFSTWPKEQSAHRVPADPVLQLAAAMKAQHLTGSFASSC
ncbi:HIT domain-containing protein [Streptomyces sp. NBC_01381]|uniref:HIT family protein n=1 Tax=Streptomyces sp. NBC_01381 TaxID=2903845 RepID=UPI002258C05E|nr:HIT domain-containing protein [Streptomyces sp. NBC_01381]MCX4666496.1 HIT domain-containing protein [Streptomyces sp. NBC_01381]